jgi:hypothetical protein
MEGNVVFYEPEEDYTVVTTREDYDTFEATDD